MGGGGGREGLMGLGRENYDERILVSINNGHTYAHTICQREGGLGRGVSGGQCGVVIATTETIRNAYPARALLYQFLLHRLRFLPLLYTVNKYMSAGRKNC